MRTAKDIIQLS